MNLSRLAILCLLPFASVYAGSVAAGDAARAYIVSPAHGEVVTTPVKVIFGLSAMGVAPAGVDKAKTGHHHLLIDTAIPDFINPATKYVVFRASEKRQIKAQLAGNGCSIDKSCNTELALFRSP